MNKFILKNDKKNLEAIIPQWNKFILKNIVKQLFPNEIKFFKKW